MPGLLLPMSLACVVGGALNQSTDFRPFAAEPAAERGVKTGITARPPIDLDAEVLLYSGMPIEIRGETKYVGDLNLYRTTRSYAACEHGRLTAIVAYVDEPTPPSGEAKGYAVVREQPGGGFQVLATDTDPVVSYPEATIEELGLLFRTPFVRFASLTDGSYRAVATLQFEPPSEHLSGQWIVDIDDTGIHPVLRLDSHPLPDSEMLRPLFELHPQADLSDPIGGLGGILPDSRTVAWRIDERAVNITANLQDLPEVAGLNVWMPGRFVIPLTDGSILAHFGISDPDQKQFAARVSERGAEIEFFTEGGAPPALPDGSERLIPSTRWRGFAFDGGYYSSLRAIPGPDSRAITAANFGMGIERFLDEQTFIDFPPFEPDNATPRIVAANDAGDVIVSRGPYQEWDSFALYFFSPGADLIPVAAKYPIEQPGIFSGYYRLSEDLLVEKSLTRDGTFVFPLQGLQSLNAATITWSREKGYRLLHAADDSLTIPDGTTIECEAFLQHVSQDPAATVFFSVAGWDEGQSSNWKIVVMRQSLDSSTPLADLNRDGEVNLLDLNIVLKGMSSGLTWGAPGNVDFDDRTDQNDLQMLLDQWGQR